MKSRSGTSYKTRDYHQYYNSVRPDDKKYQLTEGQYGKILQDVTKGLFDVLCKEVSLSFPYRLGTVYLRKIITKPEMINGKMVYVSPID